MRRRPRSRWASARVSGERARTARCSASTTACARTARSACSVLEYYAARRRQRYLDTAVAGRNLFGETRELRLALEEAGRLEVRDASYSRRRATTSRSAASSGAELQLTRTKLGLALAKTPRRRTCRLELDAEQREQGRRAPVRHRHGLPVVAGAQLRRHHRHRDRLGGADAARAGRRQPQPDRGPAELCRRTAARQRRLLRLVLPQHLRQPVSRTCRRA